jgi:hypothetical protein
MGFREGRDDTVITGNRFLELVGSARYGIEPNGQRVTITGNLITNAASGVIASNNWVFDDMTITGNTISGGEVGVFLQIATGFTGHNITISGNNINASINGVYSRGSVDNLLVSNNSITGPGISGGRGIFIDTPNTAAYVTIIGNVFSNWERPLTIYSLVATTFTNLYAMSNVMAQNVP